MIFKTMYFTDENIYKIYQEVTSVLKKENLILNSDLFVNELKERSKLGSVKVYEDMYLPHIVSSNLINNIIIRAKNNKFKFLFILINEDKASTKDKVIRIVRLLLNRDFVDKIFSVNHDDFEYILSEI